MTPTQGDLGRETAPRCAVLGLALGLSLLLLPAATPMGSAAAAPSPKQAEGPVVSSCWRTYEDEACRFALRYPSNFIPVAPGTGFAVPGAVITFVPSFDPSIDSSDTVTNLVEVSVTVAVVRSTEDGLEQRPGCVIVGTRRTLPAVRRVCGQVFYRSCSSDAGAGNVYDTVSYRTARGRWSYEIVLLLHYGNPGCYQEGTVSAFDPRDFLSILDAMVRTFRVCPLAESAG